MPSLILSRGIRFCSMIGIGLNHIANNLNCLAYIYIDDLYVDGFLSFFRCNYVWGFLATFRVFPHRWWAETDLIVFPSKSSSQATCHLRERNRCRLMLFSNINTTLWFVLQCAHGRPTTAPLVNLEALHKQIAKIASLNQKSDADQGWHGLHRHELSLARAEQRLNSCRS